MNGLLVKLSSEQGAIMDGSVTLRFNGAEIMGYINTITGECQFLMDGKMMSFASVLEVIKWWRDNH